MSDENNNAQTQEQHDAPMTAEQISAAVVAGIQAAQPRQEERQMTPEEQAHHLRVWQPTDEYITQYEQAFHSGEGTIEQKRSVLQQMRDGVVGQALRGSELIADRQVGQVRQQIAPAVAVAQQQRAESDWNAFAGKYPSLKEMRPIVDSISTQVAAEIQQGRLRVGSIDEVFTIVANRSEQAVKTVKPDFVLNSPATTTSPRPKMVQTSTGGSGPSPGNGNKSQSQLHPAFR